MSWDKDVNTRQKEVEKIIRDYWIVVGEITVTDDGIEVYGSVKFPRASSFITELPLKFNKVSGDFDCSKLSLTTLKNSPSEVGGMFDCSYNKLDSLAYLPRKIGTLVIDNMISSLSTSGINCRFNEVIFLFRTNIPNVGLHPSIVKNSRHIKSILHYQNYFDVWNEDLSLNEANFDEIIADIFDGLE